MSAVDWASATKFGLLVDMDILKKATSPNPKPEVEFQYGERLFVQTGSSYISAVD